MKEEKKYKVKKIIQIIYNILSAIIIGFVCFGLCLSSCSNKDEQAPHTTNYIFVTKSKKNVFKDNQFIYLGESEFGSYEFFYYFIDNLKNYDFVYNSDVTVEDFILGEPVDISLPNNYVDYGVLDEGDYTVNYPINRIVISYYRGSFTDELSFEFYISENSYIGVVNTINYTDENKTQFAYNNYTTINTNKYGFTLQLIRYRADLLKTLFPSEYNTEYNAEGTYLEGYNKGVNVGYANGYNKGYADASEEGALSNPFTLIGSAFTSMASILNIELFPNFTLGILVFIPVILAIIFVVVKAIKG